LKEQIAKTEKLKDDLLAAPRKPVDDAKSGAHEFDGLSPNSPLAQLQGQLKSNQVEIANRERRIDELQQRIGEYQSRLNAAPTMEQQLADVTRGYEQSKAIYDDLLRKKTASEMATNMEVLQRGQHFSILDAPGLPKKPDFPNRLQFCGVGLALGIAIGMIVAGGFEFADDRLYSDAALREVLGTAILSEVPEVVSVSDESRKKRRLAFSWALSAVVAIVILAGTTISILNG
jgi:hypothetical protein